MSTGKEQIREAFFFQHRCSQDDVHETVGTSRSEHVAYLLIASAGVSFWFLSLRNVPSLASFMTYPRMIHSISSPPALNHSQKFNL